MAKKRYRTTSDSLEAYLGRVKTTIEQRLRSTYPLILESDSIEQTYSALRYMLFLGDGGKRLRPALTMLASDACGGNQAEAWQYAQGVEEIHTYTLILDDIQDKSAKRRNCQTCHFRFGTNTALLAAMRLYERGTEPFHRLQKVDRAEARRLLDMLHRGQAADLGAKNWTAKQRTLPNLQFIHAGKTSALIRLALLGGSAAAKASSTQKRSLAEFGYYLGLAYQARDEVLSASSTEVAIGKPAGEEADRDRFTNPQLLGSAHAAQQQAVSLASKACGLIPKSEYKDVRLLEKVAEYAVRRLR
jgi:geranylgeranyl pyrophosphate synthase